MCSDTRASLRRSLRLAVWPLLDSTLRRCLPSRAASSSTTKSSVSARSRFAPASCCSRSLRSSAGLLPELSPDTSVAERALSSTTMRSDSSLCRAYMRGGVSCQDSMTALTLPERLTPSSSALVTPAVVAR